MKLVTKQQQKVSSWSGGTTTELYISPANATVSEQNFDYRISTAKVLVEKSEFTSFPNFNRKLAILEGNLKIQHNQSAWCFLEAGDQIEFSGDWETRSEGQVIDFNVIFKNTFQVEVGFMDQLHSVVYAKDSEFLGLYCIRGKGRMNDVAFGLGDFICVKEPILTVETSLDARFIQVKIIKL